MAWSFIALYLGLEIVGKRGQLNAKLSERSKSETLVVAGKIMIANKTFIH